MPTQDISRFLHQPEKHYAGVRMQQGRVMLDSDWNERSSIEAEDLRRTISELACSKGTPNGGMLVSNVADEAPYDFQIANGSYYLGGMRLVVDAADLWGETYRTQSDWLQVDATDGSTMTVPVGDRIDLVYVYAWEQPVSAVEDSELFEVALGGRDTSVRMRRMRRFHSVVVSAEADPLFNSADGFDVVVTALEASNATFDRPTSELLSDGRLLVEVYDGPPQSSEDPCTLPEVQGYVGAENQAIRVELRAGQKFTWGFDNASPLYRVKVTTETPNTLTFITEPGDLPSMPHTGQVVEVLRWGAKLPNVEKVAETQGTLHKVLTTYDPTTRQLVLDSDVTLAWINWLATHGVHHNPDDEADEQYLYLRVWDRGLDTAAAAELSYVPGGGAVPLGDTGLQITVVEDGMPGDYWIIAARPSTPDKFVPWNLDTVGGVRPHGPRRFYAPLALIRWIAGVPTVDDARTRMRTLCEGGCCKVTVGDGKESHGQVETLQEAIDLLAGSGGKICVLPGVHEGRVLLDELTDILIEGCGPRSILTNPPPEIPNTDFTAFGDPVVSIVDCKRITLKDLRIEAYSALGVHASRTEMATCERLVLDHVEIRSRGKVSAPVFELPNSCVAAYGVTGLDLLDCRFETDAIPSLSYSVVLGSEHVRMHRCSVVPDPFNEQFYVAPGGINIRSTSRDVEIVACHIEGGWAHGIALGHALQHERPEPAEPTVLDDFTVNLDDGTHQWLSQVQKAQFDGCAPKPDDVSAGGGEDDSELLWLPAGPVEDIRIHDNVIRKMGQSGISTAVFFPANFDWDNNGQADNVPRFIVAAEVDIARNLIEYNAQSFLSPAIFSLYDRGVGGIVLAASLNAWIHENTIRNNGLGIHMPVCGVGLIATQNAVIEDNRIIDNGERHPGHPEPFVPTGLRGGIVIVEATTVRANPNKKPTFPATIDDLQLPETQKDYDESSGESAVIVRGNEVSQPLGKALWVRRGFGPITVTGNTLEGFGDPVTNVEIEEAFIGWQTESGSMGRAGGGACVEILDFGKALDVDDDGVAWRELQWTSVAGGTVDGGLILFAENHVKLTWKRIRGFAANVVCASTDSVLFQGNSVHVVCGANYSAGASPSPMAQFYENVLSESLEYKFVMTNAYVGGYSSVQVGGNRFSEAKFDALFSCIAGPPLTTGPDFGAVINGIIVASNVCSHGIFAATAGANVPPLAGGEDTLNTISFKHDSFTYANHVVDVVGGDVRTVMVKYIP